MLVAASSAVPTPEVTTSSITLPDLPKFVFADFMFFDILLPIPELSRRTS